MPQFCHIPVTWVWPTFFTSSFPHAHSTLSSTDTPQTLLSLSSLDLMALLPSHFPIPVPAISWICCRNFSSILYTFRSLFCHSFLHIISLKAYNLQLMFYAFFFLTKPEDHELIFKLQTMHPCCNKCWWKHQTAVVHFER